MVAGQERPFDTTACALMQYPDRYNEGLAERGRPDHGRTRRVHAPRCELWRRARQDMAGIRRRARSPGGSPGTHSTKNRPKTFESLQLPLNQDRDFQALQKLLQDAQNPASTKMLHATLVGKYFAGKPTPTITGVIRAGYGRLSRRSLLIIEEVGTVGTDIEEPVDFSASPGRSLKPPKDCTVSELAVSSREDEDRLLRKSLEEEFAYLHDPKQVAARAIAEREGITAEEAQARLKVESITATTAAYKWLTPDGMKSYFVVVDKPYWLLQTAVSGDAVIWVPKSITETECLRKPKEAL